MMSWLRVMGGSVVSHGHGLVHPTRTRTRTRRDDGRGSIPARTGRKSELAAHDRATMEGRPSTAGFHSLTGGVPSPPGRRPEAGTTGHVWATRIILMY